ncbi:MAG: hypothetical protein V4683_01380 [Bacteroidota bacterium]
MRILLLVFFTSIFGQSFGQRNQPMIYNNRYQFGLSESRIEVLENKDTVFITKSNYKNANTQNIDEVEIMYKGTPIFKNAWFTNSVIYVDGLATKGIIAYNLLNHDIQFSAKDISHPVVVKPDSFLLAGYHFTQLGKKSKLTNTIYYERIFKNQKIGIYKVHNCNFRPKVDGQKTSYHVSTDDFEGSFIKSTDLFIYENGVLIEVKNNSAFYKYFVGKRTELEKFAKSNNLSAKKENDLIEIVKYYASL